jgi:hypothetical protein
MFVPCGLDLRQANLTLYDVCSCSPPLSFEQCETAVIVLLSFVGRSLTDGNSRCRAECMESVSTHGHGSAGFTDWNRLDVSLPSVGTSCWREYWLYIYIYIYFQNPICLKVWE